MFLGLAGVALVVWHKIDIREVPRQPARRADRARRRHRGDALPAPVRAEGDLKAAAVIQFATAAVVVRRSPSPSKASAFTSSSLLWGSVAFLVIFTSLLGVSALYWLMRHGEATRVTSMMYLPPVFAVVLEAAGSAWCRARSRSPASPSPAPAWR